MTSRDHLKPETEMKEVLKFPRAREVFMRHLFACLNCSGLDKEKLIHAARCHGVDVEMLIQEILDEIPTRE